METPVEHVPESTASAERRAFLTRAGKVGVIAPAAVLLLAATARQAAADQYGPPP